MSLDISLLRLSTSREQFDRLVPHAATEGLDELTVVMLGALRHYYKEFPEARHADIDVFGPWAEQFKFREGVSDDKKSLLRVLLKQMREPVPDEVRSGMIERLISMQLATSVVSKVVQWNSGAEINLLDEIAALTENTMERVDRKARLPLVTATPEELMVQDENDVGLHWRLRCLRDNMRPLRGGDFGIYAMRPDAGKTTFLVSETSHWITQLDEVWEGQGRTGIWLNNEGPGARIKQRWYQSLLNATTPEMIEMVKAGQLRDNIAREMGGDLTRMQFYDVHGYTSGEVEAIIKATRPGFIVFDMIDNIQFNGVAGNGGTRTDQMLESMYQGARNWCVKYDCVGIAASQMSADAEGVQFPPQKDLKDSKTGKQGACDFILMGGKLNDPAMDGFRYISTPKNKLPRPGCKRNLQVEVQFDAERARVYQEG